VRSLALVVTRNAPEILARRLTTAATVFTALAMSLV
jgi:hypothetical protein